MSETCFESIHPLFHLTKLWWNEIRSWEWVCDVSKTICWRDISKINCWRYFQNLSWMIFPKSFHEWFFQNLIMGDFFQNLNHFSYKRKLSRPHLRVLEILRVKLAYYCNQFLFVEIKRKVLEVYLEGVLVWQYCCFMVQFLR